jgi:hypothetical protein
MRALSGGNFTRHEAFGPNLDQGNINQLWEISYQTISRCLDVLENVPNINDPALNKDRVLGEARFIKATQYFHLVRYFGKVPIVKTTTKSPDQDLLLPRSEVNEVYDVIVNDLLEAEKLLPVTNGSKSRATKGAARAVLARVYLHRKAQGDLEKALAECEEVIADSQYQLVAASQYGGMFSTGNAAETIFEVSSRPSVQIEGNSALDVEMVPAPGNPFRVVPEAKALATFTDSDIRKAVCLGRFNNRDYVRKYEAGAPDASPRRLVDANIIYVRLADVILMRAECLNELGRTADAVPLLNQIRTRAGLGATTAATQAEMRQAIEDERYLELYAEGHRWFDLVRTGRAQAVIANLTNPARILWPVPIRELDLNPNLKPQNPSY